MKKPITERISRTWKTFSSAVVARPATDIIRNEAIDPAIHAVALRFDGSAAMGGYVAGDGCGGNVLGWRFGWASVTAQATQGKSHRRRARHPPLSCRTLSGMGRGG